ncbi:anaerobic sulfatase maturase [Schaalia naturae]|uniref:Anaerobic sulfatase maturase n=1 Tax=Schaalia naturae TaxID=635203 RepID=A0ABW2SM19_9ACTO
MTTAIPRQQTAEPAAPRMHFSALAKPAGAACNLDCTYCFFLSKELLYDEAGQRMSDHDLERFISDFLDSQPDGDVSIEWQGGEPTLRGLPFFKRAVELSEKYRRPAQDVTHSIQTNGTLITDEWADFLAENHFLVGLSIDGPAQYHDVYRVNKAGRGTQAQVLRAWEILQRHHVDTNILCTVHAGNADHPHEVYRYFRDALGAEFIQFIPIVERVTPAQRDIAEAGWHGQGEERPLYRQRGSDVTSRSVGPEQWGAFLSTIFDEWVKRDVGRVFVQLFDVTVGNAMGIYTLCTHSPTCGNAIAVLHNGDVYACDHYVEPAYLRGNIATESMRDIVASPEQRRFGMSKMTELSAQCQACDVRWACQGGCPKDRFVKTLDGRELNYLCEGYRTFFRHAQPDVAAMVSLVQSGRKACGIMDMPRDEDGRLLQPVPTAGAQGPEPTMSERSSGRPGKPKAKVKPKARAKKGGRRRR